MYLKKKLSAPQIARFFNCSASHIRNKLKEYNVPARSLQEALALSNKPIYPRKNFSDKPEEKAHMIGFRLGDLNIRSLNKRNSTIIVHSNSTKSEFFHLVKGLFSPYGHVRIGKPAKNGAKSIDCYLSSSFDFLIDKNDLIEPWIIKDKNCFAAFLAGYTDAEGTFCLCGGDAVFSVKSQDKNILSQIRSKLIKLGILLRPAQLVRKKGTTDVRGVVSNKDVYGIFMYRKDSIIKLSSLIAPHQKNIKKTKELKALTRNIARRNKKYKYRQDNRWYREYLAEGIKI